MIPLIPFYDLSYANQIVAAAQRRRVAVIANVDSGPSNRVDLVWKRFLVALAQSKAEIFGYVPLRRYIGNKGSPSTQAQVYSDVKLWGDLYGVKRFFFDDYGKVHPVLPAAAISVANAGVPMSSVCGTTVIWETVGYTASKPFATQKSAVIAMGERNFSSAMELARKRGVAYFYAVSAGDTWAAYDKLPRYFDAMIDEA